jgi:hypothetical protein
VKLTTLTSLKVTKVGPTSVALRRKLLPLIVADSDAPLSNNGVLDFTVTDETVTVTTTAHEVDAAYELSVGV